MKVLVACEESQRVCTAFRERGHEAYSCDIIEPSGGHPEWHILGDALEAINGGRIRTMDGKWHDIGRWDLMIAHPPCTHLAVSGARYFGKKREDGRQMEAIEFFCRLLNADCDRICIENPIGIISGNYIKRYYPEMALKYGLPKKQTQIIQPYFFGDHARKQTCLWLKNIPELKPTDIVDCGVIKTCKDGKTYSVGSSQDCARDEKGKIIKWNDPRTSVIRSRTFPGIAKAMAEQWG